MLLPRGAGRSGAAPRARATSPGSDRAVDRVGGAQLASVVRGHLDGAVHRRKDRGRKACPHRRRAWIGRAVGTERRCPCARREPVQRLALDAELDPERSEFSGIQAPVQRTSASARCVPFAVVTATPLPSARQLIIGSSTRRSAPSERARAIVARTIRSGKSMPAPGSTKPTCPARSGRSAASVPAPPSA